VPIHDELGGLFGPGEFAGAGPGGFDEVEEFRGLPVRQPAPPPPTPVAPIRTAPIPLPGGVSKLSIASPAFGSAIIRQPQRPVQQPVLIPEEVRPELPIEAVVRPPPRVTVPPMQQPCPPGFTRR